MPTYYAVDLTRLPPVSSDHCDVSAILAELQYLQSEVRAAAHISEEVHVLRQEILQLYQLRQEIDDERSDVAKLSIEEVRPLPMSTDGTSASRVHSVPKTTVLFANHAKELQNGGMSSSQEPSKLHRMPRKPVFGKAVNSTLKSVQTFRHNFFCSSCVGKLTKKDLERSFDIMRFCSLTRFFLYLAGFLEC